MLNLKIKTCFQNSETNTKGDTKHIKGLSQYLS